MLIAVDKNEKNSTDHAQVLVANVVVALESLQNYDERIDFLKNYLFLEERKTNLRIIFSLISLEPSRKIIIRRLGHDMSQIFYIFVIIAFKADRSS